MSSPPQFNLFTKPSVAAPVTSLQQAAAVQVFPRPAPATAASNDTNTSNFEAKQPLSDSENSFDSEKESDPELSPVQSPVSPRSAADKIHRLKAAQHDHPVSAASSETNNKFLNESQPAGSPSQDSKPDLVAFESSLVSEPIEHRSDQQIFKPEDLSDQKEPLEHADARNSADSTAIRSSLEPKANDTNLASGSLNPPQSRETSSLPKTKNTSSFSEHRRSSSSQPTKPEPTADYLISANQLTEVPPESVPSPQFNHSPHKTDTDCPPSALRRHSLQMMKELGLPQNSITSTEPSAEDSDSVFDYAKFMTCLRSKPADPIARYIKSFLQEFCRGSWTPPQQEKIVADFLRFISGRLREHEPFASMSKQERRNSLEGVEKLIMTRLYTRTFPPCMPPLLRTDGHTEDLLRDQLFSERLRLWSWLEGRHLDINNDYLNSESPSANFVPLATRELNRLSQFKSPRDKMICILNCSKVIFALIRQAKLEQNADSFLPLLIYVVIRSQPDNLVSTINYIQRYRNREFQRGETAYYLSTLASAVAFLEQLDQRSLTISNEEFEQKMSKSVQAETDRVIAERDRPGHPASASNSVAVEGESSATVLTASASMLVDRMRKMTTKLWEDLGPEDNVSATNPRPSSAHELRQAQLDYRAQTRAAAQASLDEYESAQSQHQQFQESLESLHNMFPLLDKELIADVLHQNGTNLGSAVDLCLALSA